jgi:hypothetical protein
MTQASLFDDLIDDLFDDLIDDLIDDSDSPLLGVMVRTRSQCKCGECTLVIDRVDVGPHAAGTSCAKCGQFVTWLGKVQARFVADFIKNFGQPSDPIDVRENDSTQ